MTKSLNVAIAGVGVVGASVYKLLTKQKELLRKRCGRDINVIMVSSRDKNKDRGIDLSDVSWVENPMDFLENNDIDVVVETIGGSEGIAYDLSSAVLKSGKALITANKAMVAHHGKELVSLVDQHKGHLAFEAAIAGGIPIIKAIREGLSGNDVNAVYGILNGTCNYMLSEMWKTGRDFQDILSDAQDLGFAESDPSFDIDGIDAGHKIALLSALAFASYPNFDAVDIRGIRPITSLDIIAAEELGYRIKLLGVARLTDKGVEQSVEPCMIPVNAPIANIEGSLNAVVANGDFVGETLFVGHGAGGNPTASAIVADIIDVARYGHQERPFGVSLNDLGDLPVADIKEREAAYYLRMMVDDKTGVIADVTAILRDCDVSMRSILQHGAIMLDSDAVPVIVMTHNTLEKNIKDAMSKISSLSSVVEEPYLMRVETFTS